MKRLLLLLLPLMLLFSLRPADANAPLAPTADTYTDDTATASNFDGGALLTNFTVFPAFNPSTATYLKFDVMGSGTIDSASLDMPILSTQLSTGSVTLGVYSAEKQLASRHPHRRRCPRTRQPARHHHRIRWRWLGHFQRSRLSSLSQHTA